MGVGAFVWMMLILKIPLLALLWLVWWSVRAEPEAAGDDVVDEGGGGSPHPRPTRPRPPRRGPHSQPYPPAPSRTRTRTERRRARRLAPSRD